MRFWLLVTVLFSFFVAEVKANEKQSPDKNETLEEENTAVENVATEIKSVPEVEKTRLQKRREAIAIERANETSAFKKKAIANTERREKKHEEILKRKQEKESRFQKAAREKAERKTQEAKEKKKNEIKSRFQKKAEEKAEMRAKKREEKQKRLKRNLKK